MHSACHIPSQVPLPLQNTQVGLTICGHARWLPSLSWCHLLPGSLSQLEPHVPTSGNKLGELSAVQRWKMMKKKKLRALCLGHNLSLMLFNSVYPISLSLFFCVSFPSVTHDGDHGARDFLSRSLCHPSIHPPMSVSSSIAPSPSICVNIYLFLFLPDLKASRQGSPWLSLLFFCFLLFVFFSCPLFAKKEEKKNGKKAVHHRKKII